MMDEPTMMWKFTRGRAMGNTDINWRKGKLYRVEGEVMRCHEDDNGAWTANGFHASEHIQDALWHVPGDTLCQVECRGDSDGDDNKTAWREMRVVRRWRWTPEASVMLADVAVEYAVRAAGYAAEYAEEYAVRAADAADAAEYAAEYAARAVWAAACAGASRADIHDYILTEIIPMLEEW